MNRFFLFLTFTGIAVNILGCAGYQIGNDTLYNTSIKTIYVPMVKSDVLRPQLGERITEAVVKEIELRTPYKVVRDNCADAVLNIQLTNYNQGINFKDTWGGPRQESLDMRVKIELVDRKTQFMESGGEFAVDRDDTFIMGSGCLIAVAGQSTATEQQEAIDKLAARIVNVLEKAW